MKGEEYIMHRDDQSYRRYKQYRLNKYRYEQEQIVFPASIVIGLACLISLWEYILIAMAVVAVIVAAGVIAWVYLKKQVVASKPVVLTKEIAAEGVEIIMNVTYNSSRVTLNVNIPPNVKNGQKFVIKNVLFADQRGRKVKKSVRFQVEISE